MPYVCGVLWLMHLVTLVLVSRSATCHGDARLTSRLVLWGWGLAVSLVLLTYLTSFLADVGVPGGEALATFAVGAYWIGVYLLLVWLAAAYLLHVGVTIGVLLAKGSEYRSAAAIVDLALIAAIASSLALFWLDR